MKNKIRPVYSELQGHLSQTPLTANNDVFYESDGAICEQLNGCIKELNEVTGLNYDRYKIIPIGEEYGYRQIGVSTYRSTVGSLISRLHAEYFSDEPPPFSGSPSTIIQQTQNQQQSMTVSLLLEIQSKIDDRLHTAQDEEEKTFLSKVKEYLPTVKNGVELIKLIADLANQTGISLDKLTKIFS